MRLCMSSVGTAVIAAIAGQPGSWTMRENPSVRATREEAPSRALRAVPDTRAVGGVAECSGWRSHRRASLDRAPLMVERRPGEARRAAADGETRRALGGATGYR